MQLIKLCEMHLITKVYGNTVAVVAKVSEIEKRGTLRKHQICSSYILPFQSSEDLSNFILGLWAHRAFCFTNPTFEAVDGLLSEVVVVKPEV